MRFEPLGDQAVMAYADDEIGAAGFAARVRRAAPAWAIDVVQAYASVAVFYELAQIDFFHARHLLTELVERESHGSPLLAQRRHVIPCCYELGLDLERIASHTGLENEAIIRLHADAVYTVYAIGFCPGFPYLGYLAEQLANVPRLRSPRLKVEAGSVGLTGRQTGIYTEARPGGWNIVGRTPLELVNVADNYFPLRTGDEVRFERVDARKFEKLRGRRLPLAD